MTTRVVTMNPAPDPGATLLVDGVPCVVVAKLPKLRGRLPAVRVSPDLPCGVCEAASLRFDPARRCWCCPSCRTTYGRAALADLTAEHVADGARAGHARRDRQRRTRQVRRGAPGAAAVLLRAAADGGTLSRAALVDLVTGAERRALRWALRDDGDRPLSPERCREVARALASLGGPH